MFRSLLSIILILSLAACGGTTTRSEAAGDLWQRVSDSRILRVGVKADTPPFGVKQDDIYVGFDVELILAIADEIGIKDVVFVPVTSANRIDKLNAGEVDCVIASMTITRTREQQVDFTIPYFQDGQALLVKADSPITGYIDLAGRNVGAVKGSTSAANLAQVAPEARVVTVANFTDLRAALDAGTVDAITSDSVILIGIAKNSPTSSAYRIAGEPFSTEPYGIAVPENQSRLRDALNEGLQRIWENGRWQVIFDTWFGPRARYAAPIRFVLTPFPH